MAYQHWYSESGKGPFNTKEEAIAEDEREEREKDPLAKLKLPWKWDGGFIRNTSDEWCTVARYHDLTVAAMNLLPLIRNAAKNVGKPEAMQGYAQLLSAYFNIEDMAKRL